MTDTAPIAKTRLQPSAEFSASDLKHSGAVLEAVNAHNVVRITRRGTNFLLLREDYALQFAADLTDDTPKSLEEMLDGFTPEDAVRLREQLAGWRDDPPQGKELI